MIPGSGPLILTFAGTGTNVPPLYYRRLSLQGQAMADTDWHLDRFWYGLCDGATRVRANFNRCLSDLNAGPALDRGSAQSPEGVIPLRTRAGEPVWAVPPTTLEIAHLKSAFYVPYHAALAAQIARVRAKHGLAFVLDCQSLPLMSAPQFDLSLDSCFGAACAPMLAARVAAICTEAPGLRLMQSGRRQTGWTTCSCGRPKSGVHALQITVAQSAYLSGDADTLIYDAEKAETLRALMRDVLAFIAGWRPD